MGSLSKFIEKHLANKKIEDYESWLSLYGKDADKQYGERLASAERTFAKGHATYGDLAADLKDKGLTGRKLVCQPLLGVSSSAIRCFSCNLFVVSFKVIFKPHKPYQKHLENYKPQYKISYSHFYYLLVFLIIV